jgi:hypothetical protein
VEYPKQKNKKRKTPRNIIHIPQTLAAKLKFTLSLLISKGNEDISADIGIMNSIDINSERTMLFLSTGIDNRKSVILSFSYSYKTFPLNKVTKSILFMQKDKIKPW